MHAAKESYGDYDYICLVKLLYHSKLSRLTRIRIPVSLLGNLQILLACECQLDFIGSKPRYSIYHSISPYGESRLNDVFGLFEVRVTAGTLAMTVNNANSALECRNIFC